LGDLVLLKQKLITLGIERIPKKRRRGVSLWLSCYSAEEGKDKKKKEYTNTTTTTK